MSRMIIAVFLALFFSVSSSTVAVHAQPAEIAEEGVEDLTVSSPGNVTLDFRDADIRNILRIISYKSGVNIVPGPEVSGTVSIQLTDVPWETALSVILKTYGFGYERQGNIIVVNTLEKLSEQRMLEKEMVKQEPLATEVFVLNFAKADEVVSSVRDMLSSRGKINYDERTNTVMVTDGISSVEKISEVIPRLDAVTPQVLIECKVIETKLNDSDKLGIDWTAQVTAFGGVRPMTWPFGQSPKQDYLRDSGSFPAPEDTDFKYGTLDFSGVQAVLELLYSRTDTNTLSNPRIVTLDNQPARITVGTKWPVGQYTYNTDQAKWQVSGWEYLEFGILLKVTPHVNQAGFVTLEIEPEVSDQNGEITFEDATIPILTTQETSTRVMIKDGETLIIAGLIKDKKIDTRKKVPILGDIPLLGLLFQKKEATTEKTDLLIFITPHIITPSITPPTT
ncbi:type IV pilus secretin PilQ [Candidatus Omnitrophota bacterium]